MNLKLAICKKEGTTNYGSNGASAEVSIELDPDFSIEMVSQASALWHQALTAAVDSQLARMRTAPQPQPEPDSGYTSLAGSGMTRTGSRPPDRNGRSIPTACGTTADPGGELARRLPGGSCSAGPASTGRTRPSSSWARAGSCPTA
jgi:hypothetical protein